MNGVLPSFISAWYLRKIVAPNGEKITFTYDPNKTYSQPSVSSLVNQYFDQGLVEGGVPQRTSCGLNFSVANILQGGGAVLSIWVSRTRTEGWILKRIEYEMGEIEFQGTTRTDMGSEIVRNGNAIDLQMQSRLINTIVVRRRTSSNLIETKRIILHQSYFNDAKSANNTEKALWRRLRLDDVTQSVTGESIPSTQFTYILPTQSTIDVLPPKTSLAKDYMGYYNGATGNGISTVGGPTSMGVPLITVNRPYSGGSVTLTYFSADREPNALFSSYGTLQQIQYPTGGTTDFNYEQHRYYLYSANNTGCGLRIKEIRTKESPNSAIHVQTFEYLDPTTGNSSGKIMAPTMNPAVYNEFQIEHIGLGYCSTLVQWLGYHIMRHASSLVPMGSSAQGNAFGYSVVTVYDGTIAGENGKSVHYYYNEPEVIGNITYVAGVPNHPNPLNGTLTRKVIYKRLGSGAFSEVTETINQYSLANPGTSASHLKGAIQSLDLICPPSYGNNEVNGRLLLGIKYYDLDGFWLRLDQTTERQFDQNGSGLYTQATTTYSYTDHYTQPTLTTHVLADGTIRKIYTKYAGDYLSLSTTGASVVGSMSGSLHLHTAPVEQYTTLTHPGDAEKLVAGQFTHYGLVGAITPHALPQRIDQLDLVQPVRLSTDFTPSTAVPSSTPSDPQPDARYYTTKQTFSYEAAAGNLLTQQPLGDALTSFQWGYANPTNPLAGQYPVAQFINSNRTPPVIGSPAIGNEASYVGFESLTAQTDNPSEDYWSDSPTSNNTLVGDAHTGTSAWRIGAAPSGGYNVGLLHVFQPQRNNDRYKFSAWVKSSAGFGSNAGEIALLVYTSGGPRVFTAPVFQHTLFGDTQGKWRFVETAIDLAAARQSLGLAANAVLRVEAYLCNIGDPSYFLVDDVRFLPDAAVATTYTYDCVSQQPSSISGANSQPMYYEYDGAQRLKIVRDELRNIVKHYEYHYKR